MSSTEVTVFYNKIINLTGRLAIGGPGMGILAYARQLTDFLGVGEEWKVEIRKGRMLFIWGNWYSFKRYLYFINYETERKSVMHILKYSKENRKLLILAE